MLPAVTMKNVAVSDTRGLKPFRDDNDATNSISFEETHQTIEVVTDTLDNLLGDKVAKTKVLKIDIEGYEIFALRGGKNCLKHARAVIIETDKVTKFDVEPIEVHQLLVSMGFQLVEFDLHNNVVRANKEMNKSGNSIYVKHIEGINEKLKVIDNTLYTRSKLNYEYNNINGEKLGVRAEIMNT